MRFSGITTGEAVERLKKYGHNEIKEMQRVSPLRILLRQVRSNFIIYLLFVAMMISFFVDKSATAYTILGVIIIVILTGFFQEYKAERSIKALRNMLIPLSTAIRNGKETEVFSRELVPDDIIILRSGEKVPADCVILEANDLSVNESILTGEAKEISKHAASGEASKDSMLFMGSLITNGRCVAKVTHTGMNTEFGKIANLISSAEKELPLQRKVNNIAKYMAAVGATISVLTGIIMLTKSAPITTELIIETLIVVIALSVAAFPEGFPVVLTTTLASGAYRMAKRNAIVNRLSAIEALGETTVICSDKTGTITKGEMTVRKIYADGEMVDITGSGYQADGDFFIGKQRIEPKKHKMLGMILKSMVLCNDSRIERVGINNEYRLIGNATEGALLIAAAKARTFKDDMKAERVEEIPFSSQRKMMSVMVKEGGELFIYTKGAPEILIKKCEYIQDGSRTRKLSKQEKNDILYINNSMANKSLRTIAIAYKKTRSKSKGTFESNLIFLGLAAMEDPPREDVKRSLELCATAGIKVKMVTGDNKETAESIAKEIGLKGRIMEGDEIDKITDDELAKMINEITIFARVRPEHKIRIVRALKSNNEVVTMTGDGVNDAPALKEAHIGVAMGKKGTDVSREAADMVLKDDKFSTIVDAIAEGRNIFTNIRKFITYQLSCNVAELSIIFVGILLGLPLPLLALQILFMNMVTADIPAITLGLNPQSKEAMRREPRRNAQILNKDLFILLFVSGAIMALGTLCVFTYILNVQGQPIETARTATLITLIFFEIFHAFSFRSLKRTNYQIPASSNMYLIYASIISLTATVFIVYSPVHNTFGLSPIGISYWIIACAVGFSVTLIIDLVKIINNKKRFLELY